MSPGPWDSGTPLGLNQVRGLWSSTGPHLDVVTLVTTGDSPGLAYSVPHLNLIAVDTFLASPGTGDSNLSAHHADLVTLVLTWASLVPGDSVPQLSLTWT